MKGCAVIACALVIFFGVPVAVEAHPGRTDAYGCHTCRTNCPNWGLSSGEYHCHNAKTLPQPEDPIRSHYGENGTGTTEPWPEYKNPSTGSQQIVPMGSLVSSITPASASLITYTLAEGMENSQVVRLQQVLARYPDIYPQGLVTGHYGALTMQAVKRFQKKHGLEQVGYVGPQTRRLLNAL